MGHSPKNLCRILLLFYYILSVDFNLVFGRTFSVRFTLLNEGFLKCLTIEESQIDVVNYKASTSTF